MKQIIFKSLYLENFKCHQLFEMELNTNKLLMVVGANGSGKTTIIDAIIWAIFDETSKGIGGDSVVNNIVGKNCYVRIVFEKDGVEYEIHNYRKHSKYKNTKILYQNGIQLSTDMDVKETNNIIKNIFISKDVFLNCMLFSQYISKSFTTMSHSGQKEILDSILMLDKFDQYHDIISDNINISKRNLENIQYSIEGIDSKIELHANNINSENEKLKSNIEYNHHQYKQNQLHRQVIDSEIQKLIQTLDLNKLNYYESRLKEIESTEVKLTTELNELKKSYQFHLDAIKNSSKIEYTALELELNNQHASEILNLNSSITEKTTEINTIENNTVKSINEIRSNINILNNEIIDITNKINTIKDTNIKKETDKYTLNMNAITLELSTIEYNFLRHDSTINNLRNSINSLELQIKSFEESKAANKCNACNQPLNDSIQSIDSLILGLRNDADVARTTLSSEEDNHKKCGILKSEKELDKNNIIAVYNKFIEDVETGAANKIKELTTPKIDTISEMENTIVGLNTTLQNSTLQLKSKLELLQKNLKDKGDYIKNEIVQLKTRFNTEFQSKIAEFKATHLNSIEVYETQINQCTIDKSAIQIELKSLNDIQENITLKNKELSEIDKKMEVLASSTKAIKKNTTDFINATNENIKALVGEKSILHSNFSALNEELEIIKFWKKAFGDVGIKSILMDESIPILNKRARELSEFIGVLRVTFSSQKTLKSGKSNNKFSINVVHNTKLSEYSDLSAGETKLANIIILLCIRHLLEYMSGYRTNILLLDELLDSLDEENSAIVVSIFELLSKDYLVLLITHTQKEWIQADEELRM